MDLTNQRATCKDSTNLVFTDEAAEVEPVCWNTGELTVCICGENAIWKGEQA